MTQTLDIQPGVEKGFFSRCRYVHLIDTLMNQSGEYEGHFMVIVERQSDKASFWTAQAYYGFVDGQCAGGTEAYVESKLAVAWRRIEHFGTTMHGKQVKASKEMFKVSPECLGCEYPEVKGKSRFSFLVPHYDRLMPLFAEAYGCEYV